MPRKIVEVGPKEVEDLIKFLEKTACEKRTHRIFVSHEALRPLLEEDNVNRIRHELKSQLQRNQISINFSAEGYSFTLPQNLPLDKIHVESNRIDIADSPVRTTFTQFETPYITPNQFRIVRAAVARGRKCLIVGPPGSGKSRMYEQLAANAGIRAIRTPLSRIEDPKELIGTYQVVIETDSDGKKTPCTKFIDGVVTMCMRKGYFCILDELDNASPSANEALKQILEDGGKLVVDTEHGTEEITPHPNFRLGFTANTWGHGDSTGLFPNANSQNAATMDRIRPKFYLPYQPQIEKAIISSMVPKAVLDALYDHNDKQPEKNGLVYIIREAIEKKEIPVFLTLRSIIGFAKDFSYYGWNRSFLYNVINDFDPDDRGTICDIVQSRLGKWALPTEDTEYLNQYAKEIRDKGFDATDDL